MLFQFKICFFCQHVQMEALSSTLKDLTETEEESESKVGGGDRRELLSVCWWANSISGDTMEPEADFKKANCNSEQCGNCLVSSSPMWWVNMGEEAGTRGKDHITVGPAMGGNWKRNCLKCVWNALKWKSGRLMAASWIHSEGHSIGFDQIEWVNRWGSSESTQTMMLLPRWRA